MNEVNEWGVTHRNHPRPRGVGGAPAVDLQRLRTTTCRLQTRIGPHVRVGTLLQLGGQEQSSPITRLEVLEQAGATGVSGSEPATDIERLAGVLDASAAEEPLAALGTRHDGPGSGSIVCGRATRERQLDAHADHPGVATRKK